MLDKTGSILLMCLSIKIEYKIIIMYVIIIHTQRDIKNIHNLIAIGNNFSILQ